LDNFQGIARLLIIAGLAIAVIGGIMFLAGRLPFLGKLPGDIMIKKENVTFFFPIATFVIISIILTVIVNVIIRIVNK